jgi:hypothetical protein
MDIVRGWWKQLQLKSVAQDGPNEQNLLNISSNIIQGFMVKKRMAQDK